MNHPHSSWTNGSKSKCVIGVLFAYKLLLTLHPTRTKSESQPLGSLPPSEEHPVPLPSIPWHTSSLLTQR